MSLFVTESNDDVTSNFNPSVSVRDDVDEHIVIVGGVWITSF